MILPLGDFPVNFTPVCIPFDAFAAATVTGFVASDVLIYKDASTTQRTSASGIAVTTSFDAQVGLEMITIDLSDNTDAGFYAAGHEYQVGVADIVVDGQVTRFWAATFSIERAGGTLALIKARLPNATPGAAGGVFIAGTNAPVTITGSGNALTLTSTGGNGYGLLSSGQGSGAGGAFLGGATGSGLIALSQGTAAAFYAIATGSNAFGILAQGIGTGSGLAGLGGNDGHGIIGQGGVNTTPTGTHGIYGQAGSNNGTGLRGQGCITNGDGNSIGIGGIGSVQGGDGIKGVVTADGFSGFKAIGQAGAAGLSVIGGIVGPGFEALGGATSGAGAIFMAQSGNSDGFRCVKAGSGFDINANLTWNASWDAEVQSEVQDALDSTIADSVPADGTRPSISQALYMTTQFLLERSVSGTTVTVNKVDGTTALYTMTINSAVTPTSITRAT